MSQPAAPSAASNQNDPNKRWATLAEQAGLLTLSAQLGFAAGAVGCRSWQWATSWRPDG